jgi:uncharacterized membrane protein YhhN
MSQHPAPQTQSQLELAVLGVAAVLGLFAARALSLPYTALFLKPVPVLLMVLWVWRVTNRADLFARLVRYGLCCGLVGDILLEPLINRFVPGLVAFLIGHVLYIVAFCQDCRRLALLRLVPFVATGGVLLWVLWPGIAPLRVPVIVYTAVLVTMAWRAWARLTDRPSARPDQWTLALGATLFVISDGILAYNRFGHTLPFASVSILLTYWAAQLGIARSVLRSDAPSR